MGKLEIVALSVNSLNDVPEWNSHPYSCKYCVYWEYPEECVDPRLEKKEDVFRKKLQWLKKTKKQFGNCGKLIYVDGKCVAYSQYAPARLLPNAFRYNIAPSSKDTVLISCLFIPAKEHMRSGLGAQLLKSIIADLKERGIRAVETFARKGSPANPSGPVEFYRKNGFEIIKDDKEFPLMGFDL